jgi:large subunit ribosomal protein L35
MPKLKSRRGVAKRFKVTKTGKVKHKKAYARHHFWAKHPDQKRRLRKPNVLIKTEAKIIRTLLPYS